MWALPPPGADPGFLKGGGGCHSEAGVSGADKDLLKGAFPWTLSAWRHPPSKKLKNTPTLGHSQAPPPPFGHCPWDVIHIPRGGDRSRSRTLCIGFQYRDKFKGGGVITPVAPPPWIRHCILGLQTKMGGSNFGPNVKKPTSWPKRGGLTPWTPPPPRIRYWPLRPVEQPIGSDFPPLHRQSRATAAPPFLRPPHWPLI